MPRIPKRFINSAVYLYHSVQEAESGVSYGGTGFLVGVPARAPNSPDHLYLVTNWHVAIRGNARIVRINEVSGGSDILEMMIDEWVFDPQYDVAVAPIKLSTDKHLVTSLPYASLETEANAKRIELGPGDDVFMVGRFMNNDRAGANNPAVRFGHISTLPAPVKQPNGCVTDAWCLDMNSRSGYSGSPVFAYRQFHNDLTIIDHVIEEGMVYSIRRPYLMCIGIHFGQFPEYWQIEASAHGPPLSDEIELEAAGNYVRGLSGMTCVLPSWRIRDLIDSTTLYYRRDHLDAGDRSKSASADT